jgi:hypothetical protein
LGHPVQKSHIWGEKKWKNENKSFI